MSNHVTCFTLYCCMSTWQRSISVVIFLNWVDVQISMTGCAISVILWSQIVFFSTRFGPSSHTLMLQLVLAACLCACLKSHLPASLRNRRKLCMEALIHVAPTGFNDV